MTGGRRRSDRSHRLRPPAAIRPALVAVAIIVREARTQTRGERRSEIYVRDGIVEHELADGSGDFHLTIEHDVGAIDNIQSLLHVMVADQNTDAAVTEIGNNALNVMHGDRI